jgi:hypothetical protein
VQTGDELVRQIGPVHQVFDKSGHGSNESGQTSAAFRSLSQSTAASRLLNAPSGFTRSLEGSPPRSNRARQG